MTAITGEAWADGLRTLHKESGGLVEIAIFDSESTMQLLVRAAQGDERSEALFRAVAEAGQRVVEAPRRSPTLCVSCPRPVTRIRRTTVFGCVVPMIDAPSRALAFVFCHRCVAAGRATLADRAAVGLRQLWPDLRPIAITHTHGGNA